MEHTADIQQRVLRRAGQDARVNAKTQQLLRAPLIFGNAHQQAIGAQSTHQISRQPRQPGRQNDRQLRFNSTCSQQIRRIQSASKDAQIEVCGP